MRRGTSGFEMNHVLSRMKSGEKWSRVGHLDGTRVLAVRYPSSCRRLPLQVGQVTYYSGRNITKLWPDAGAIPYLTSHANIQPTLSQDGAATSRAGLSELAPELSPHYAFDVSGISSL